MPVATPTAVALPARTTSSRIHTTSVAAGASMVFTKASAAEPLAALALPPLKPNQPNHKTVAPSSTKGTLCGSKARRP